MPLWRRAPKVCPHGKDTRDDRCGWCEVAALRAVTIGYAPSTSSRSPVRAAWLREVSRETHISIQRDPEDTLQARPHDERTTTARNGTCRDTRHDMPAWALRALEGPALFVTDAQGFRGDPTQLPGQAAGSSTRARGRSPADLPAGERTGRSRRTRLWRPGRVLQAGAHERGAGT